MGFGTCQLTSTKKVTLALQFYLLFVDLFTGNQIFIQVIKLLSIVGLDVLSISEICRRVLLYMLVSHAPTPISQIRSANVLKEGGLFSASLGSVTPANK